MISNAGGYDDDDAHSFLCPISLDLTKDSSKQGSWIIGIELWSEDRRRHPWPVAGRRREVGGGGKLVLTLGQYSFMAAASYARATSSAERKVPSHRRVFFHGSLISAENLPHDLFLTPRYLTSLSSPDPMASPAAALLPAITQSQRRK
nr:hypothetical protein KK1_025912 [Ipomoea batatas]